MAPPGCCKESKCRRSQPIKIVRSELTGTWYALTRYKDKGNGALEAIDKHAIEPESAAQLERMREGNLAHRADVKWAQS